MKFITFAAGKYNGKEYSYFGKRLINQANNTNLFDELILYNESYLKNDTDFWNKHSEFISNNKNIGYGYWLWKPYIIKKTFEKIKNDDVLLYLDCCCEIDVRKSNEIKKLANNLKNNLIADCLSISPDKFYNKMDIVNYLNLESKQNERMHQAGALMFYKCDKTMNFINEWYELCCNYHFIDNSVSILPNDVTFKSYRNDQSIYSLLIKKYNFNTNTTLVNCIEYIRNKHYDELCNYKLMKDKYINLNRVDIFTKLDKTASDNDINSIFELANCYYEGYGTEINYEKSIELYKKAANSNHVEALYWLGMCNLFGKDDYVRDRKGIELIKKAAKLNHILSQVALGNRGISY